jgi:hypothetical protein
VHDEVVDHALDVAEHGVLEADHRGLGADSQRGPAALGVPRRALGVGQAQAGAGVGALGQRAVRRAGRGTDLRPRAEALVERTRGVEARDRVGVELEPRGLVDDLAVPVDAERRDVGELLLVEARPDAARVEILHPDQVAAARRAGEQPRQQRRA